MKQAFDSWAEYRKKILYGGMKTLKTNGGEIVWHPGVFRFAPILRLQGCVSRTTHKTKGKIESGVKYVRRNFLWWFVGRGLNDLRNFNRPVATVDLGGGQSRRSRKHI
jgi:hypothetical protein